MSREKFEFIGDQQGKNINKNLCLFFQSRQIRGFQLQIQNEMKIIEVFADKEFFLLFSFLRFYFLFEDGNLSSFIERKNI